MNLVFTDRKRHATLYVLAGIVLIGLLFGSLLFLKQRDAQYAKTGDGTQTSKVKPAVEKTDKPSTNSQTSTPKTTPDTNQQSAATTEPQQTTPVTPNSTPQQQATPTQALPATGPASNILTIFSIMAVVYAVLRYRQSRRTAN